MACMAYVVFSLCIIWLTVRVDGQKCVLSDDKRSVEGRLKKDLLCNYDKSERPVRDHKIAVNVTVKMMLKQMMLTMQEAFVNPTFMVNSWMIMSWKDEYLKWNPGEYSDIKQIQISSTSIWLPGLTLYNGRYAFNPDGRFTSICLLHNTGDLVCVPHIAYFAVCQPNLKAWPFDTQNCTLVMGSWMNTGEETNFLLPKDNAVSIDDFTPSTEWDLKSVDAVREATVKCCPNQTYPMLTYIFNMKRHNSHQIAAIIWPAVVMTVLTLTSILIDIDNIERVILLSLNLICHFFEMQHLYGKLPPSGEDSPSVLLFFRDSMIITAFVLTFTVGLRCIAKFKIDAPKWLSANFIMESMPGKIIMFNEFDPSDDTAAVIENADIDKQVNNVKKWRVTALFINRIAFVVIFVVYVLLIIALIP